MDPLSLTASIIAVAGLAAKTSQAFCTLRETCKTLPGRLHALRNEVTDIQLVLHQVASVCKKRAHDPDVAAQGFAVQHLINQAEKKLEDLNAILLTLTRICATNRIPLLRVHKWRKDQPLLQALQEDIRSIKGNLNIVLGASNSHDLTRIKIDLQSVSFANLSAAQGYNFKHIELQNNLSFQHDRLMESLATVQQRIDLRIDDVENLLEAQSRQMQGHQYTQVGSQYGLNPVHSRERRRTTQRSRAEEKEHLEGIGIRLTSYICSPTCPCTCHLQVKSVSPTIFDRALGQIFISYAGLPTAHVGPQFALSSLRRVPDSAQCVNFALNGNVEGLKDLFQRGLASPRDVSSTRGYSMLRWAMYGRQYQTCKFLLNAGADAEYRPIALSDYSPRNKAHQALLMGDLSSEDEEALRYITQGSDFIDEQGYTQLHKIVLGLSMMDLEKTILSQPETLNAVDAMGRTALAWAACRGDDRAISTAGQTPLTTAIAYNSHNVLRLLLDRWFEYSECPRLKGPDLLQIVALYADAETMSILSTTDHLRLKYDQTYGLSDFQLRLSQRLDGTEKLAAAFADLLAVIQQSPAANMSAANLMESGLASFELRDKQDQDQETGLDDVISRKLDEVYENALEYL
ncbi:hypothetical protein MMC25_002630 [Agyrium rufum]|nr:hypothetical protein [Agyrium rufum]